MLTKPWLKFLGGSSLPPRWFFAAVLPESERQAKTGRLHVEIVSHCWQYSRLLAYQLDSLVRHPPAGTDVTMTVFYSTEDAKTVELLELAGSHSPANVRWNWQALPKEKLFRRSIGRNQAALATKADWVWFTDCDMTFQEGCLDSLSAALQGRTDALVYPRLERRTMVHTDTDLVSNNSLDEVQLLQAPTDLFKDYHITRATGPLQVTHGDVARHNGYCNDVSLYQRPAATFQKATEDRFFRYLMGTQGTPIHVEGAYRIQHVEKGRYDGETFGTRVRKAVRRVQYAWRNRSRS
jgi:hypothetical protein